MNTTSSLKEMELPLFILYSTLSVPVIICNGIVFIVIIKSRELHLPTLWNIAFMAAWDFSYGLYYLVFAVPSTYINSFAYPDAFQLPAAGLLALITGQNILNILLSLVDRFISVWWPLHYPILMSAKRFSLAAMCMFIINIIRLCLIIFSESVVEYIPYLGLCVALDSRNSQLAAVGIMLMSAVCIVVILTYIGVKLRTRSDVTAFTNTMYLSTIVYIISYMPATVSFILAVTIGSENVPVWLLQFATTCILSNSLWNVFIYSATYTPFRDAFLRLFFPSFFRERRRREVQQETRMYAVGRGEAQVQ